MLDDFFASGDIALRGLISVVVLFIYTRILGKRQISQISFFDYVIGISIGSIAAEMTMNQDAPYHHAVIAMGMYAFSALGISILTNKSIFFRRLFEGAPLVLIDNGKLLKKNLNRNHIDINEFLAQCRLAGYFNVCDIKYAIMETTGKISFMPYEAKKNVMCEDLNLTPQTEGLVANVIIDGKIMQRNLKAVGKDETWLRNNIKAQNGGAVEDIFLATVDRNHSLSLFYQRNEAQKTTFFD